MTLSSNTLRRMAPHILASSYSPLPQASGLGEWAPHILTSSYPPLPQASGLGEWTPHILASSYPPLPQASGLGGPLNRIAQCLSKRIAVVKNNYNYFHFSCWMKRDAIIYAFLIPIGAVIIANLVMFTLIVRGLTCSRPSNLRTNQSERAMAVMYFKVIVAVFILVGK